MCGSLLQGALEMTVDHVDKVIPRDRPAFGIHHGPDYSVFGRKKIHRVVSFALGSVNSFQIS